MKAKKTIPAPLKNEKEGHAAIILASYGVKVL